MDLTIAKLPALSGSSVKVRIRFNGGCAFTESSLGGGSTNGRKINKSKKREKSTRQSMHFILTTRSISRKHPLI